MLLGILKNHQHTIRELNGIDLGLALSLASRLGLTYEFMIGR